MENKYYKYKFKDLKWGAENIRKISIPDEKLVYLDHNIIIEYRDKNQNIIKMVEELLKKKFIIYSPAHLEEVNKIGGNSKKNYDEIKKMHMETISELTENIVFRPTRTEGVFLLKEKPSKVLNRVLKYPEYNSKLEKTIEEVENPDMEVFFQKQWDINKTEITNLSPDDIFKDSDICIGAFECMRKSVKHDSVNFETKTINKEKLQEYFKTNFQSIETTIEFLMRLLNMFGYWHDKKKDNSFNRANDTTHTIYASYASEFITADKRLYLKVLAIYNFLGIQTKVKFYNMKKNKIENYPFVK